MLFRPTDRRTDRPTHQTIRSTQHGIFECTHAYPSGLCKTKLRIPLENEGAATRMHRARYMSSFRTTASNDYQFARYNHVHAIQSDIHRMYQRAWSPLHRSLRHFISSEPHWAAPLNQSSDRLVIHSHITSLRMHSETSIIACINGCGQRSVDHYDVRVTLH